MSNSIGIGVLGCGRIGVMHAELIAQRIEGAHLAGVYDVVTESAKKIATKFDCKHFESPDALMSAPEVGAIAICTSTDTHVEVLLMASKYRKPVFCEKPISLSLSETDKALKAISDSKTPLMLGFNRRFDPSHRSVRDNVANGTIGDVHIARITSRDPSPPPVWRGHCKLSGTTASTRRDGDACRTSPFNELSGRGTQHRAGSRKTRQSTVGSQGGHWSGLPLCGSTGRPAPRWHGRN